MLSRKIGSGSFVALWTDWGAMVVLLFDFLTMEWMMRDRLKCLEVAKIFSETRSVKSGRSPSFLSFWSSDVEKGGEIQSGAVL